jgi:hypothetical protein
MRFRMGLIIGFGAGYYLGTAAGRERHEQIKQAIRKIKRSDAYETATEKAKAAVDLTTERAKEFVDEHKPSNGHAKADLDAIGDLPTRV